MFILNARKSWRFQMSCWVMSWVVVVVCVRVWEWAVCVCGLSLTSAVKPSSCLPQWRVTEVMCVHLCGTNERPELSTIVIQSIQHVSIMLSVCDLFVWFSPCQGWSGLYMNSFILLFLSQIPWQMLWFVTRFTWWHIFLHRLSLPNTEWSLHSNIYIYDHKYCVLQVKIREKDEKKTFFACSLSNLMMRIISFFVDVVLSKYVCFGGFESNQADQDFGQCSEFAWVTQTFFILV